MPRIPIFSTRRMARTYVGRIVFASFCDKLFDIDEKLNIVPQLALSPRDLGRRQGGHHQAAARRQIPRRRAVRRRGREVLARAPPDDAGLVPQAGTGQRRPCRRGRSPDHQAGAEDAVLAADRAAHRPRRHDGLAQGGQGGGRQVRPASGLRRALQIRRARAAGPHRVRKIRRLLEQGQHPHRPRGVSADRRRHGAARQSEIRRARPDRARARDRHQGCAGAIPKLEAVDRDRARLSGHHAQHRQGQGQGSAQPVRQGAAGARSLDRSRGDQPGGVQRRVQARQSVGQSGPSLLSEGVPGPHARRRQGQGAAEGSRRHAAGQRRFHGAEGRGDRSGRPGRSSRWRRKPAST